MTSRNRLIYGTEEPPAPRRRLAAGNVSAELDGGNLRYIRWGGLEVLRAISFVVRNTDWGTYSPALTGVTVTETADSFTVRYTAACDGAEGAFHYSAAIDGAADGSLRFAANGTTPGGFATNRTGFVVLHGLDGVVGRPLTVTHPSGAVTQTRFPAVIQPDQPAMDIRALTHAPHDGLTVTVAFDGDIFEMEDQRNWTDASFKTYSRPLSRGFPYRLAPEETLAQSVHLRIQGAAPAQDDGATGPIRVAVGAATGGTAPLIGLFLDAADAGPIAAPLIAKLAACRPSVLVARSDGRNPFAQHLAACASLAGQLGCPLALEFVIQGISPPDELAGLHAWLRESGAKISGLSVFPARDLVGRPPHRTPNGEASAEAILAEARRLFPGLPLGGGMPVAFTELNRNRPPSGIDFVSHATQAIVHAGDDTSVMETLTALPDIAASVRALVGDIPYRIGPASIGMVPFASAPTTTANPDSRRMPLANDDPRQRGLFAAAFAIGYAAAAAKLGVGTLTLASPTGAFGLFGDAPYPLATAFAGLADLAGAKLLDVAHTGGDRIAAVAALTGAGKVLWLANLTPDALAVDCPGAWRVLDAAALAAGTTMRDFAPDGPVTLDAYAIARIQV